MEQVCCRAPGMGFFFPYTNSAPQRRGQNPTSSASRAGRWVRSPWPAFSLPTSQPPPRPPPLPPFTANLGVFTPRPCSFPRAVGPRPAATRNRCAFIFLALNFNQMQMPNTLQTQRPVRTLIAGAGDTVCRPGEGQDGTPVPAGGDGAAWPFGSAQNPCPTRSPASTKGAQGGFWDPCTLPAARTLHWGFGAESPIRAQTRCRAQLPNILLLHPFLLLDKHSWLKAAFFPSGVV